MAASARAAGKGRTTAQVQENALRRTGTDDASRDSASTGTAVVTHSARVSRESGRGRLAHPSA